MADLNVVGINWQKSPATFAEGDLNGDGKVDVGDLNIVGLNWQTMCGPAAAHPAEAAAVPEPSAMVLILLGASFVIVRRRS